MWILRLAGRLIAWSLFIFLVPPLVALPLTYNIEDKEKLREISYQSGKLTGPLWLLGIVIIPIHFFAKKGQVTKQPSSDIWMADEPVATPPQKPAEPPPPGTD